MKLFIWPPRVTRCVQEAVPACWTTPLSVLLNIGQTHSDIQGHLIGFRRFQLTYWPQTPCFQQWICPLNRGEDSNYRFGPGVLEKGWCGRIATWVLGTCPTTETISTLVLGRLWAGMCDAVRSLVLPPSEGLGMLELRDVRVRLACRSSCHAMFRTSGV